jgi:hypothetical protein
MVLILPQVGTGRAGDPWLDHNVVNRPDPGRGGELSPAAPREGGSVARGSSSRVAHSPAPTTPAVHNQHSELPAEYDASYIDLR